MAAIASYLDADEDLPSFFARLCAMLAEETRGRKVAFWRLGPRGTLALQPASFGFGDASPVHQMRLPLGTRGGGGLERLAFAGGTGLCQGTIPDPRRNLAAGRLTGRQASDARA